MHQYDADMDLDDEEEQLSLVSILGDHSHRVINRRLQRLRSERDHLQFPDEVDTPTNTLARVRFQK